MYNTITVRQLMIVVLLICGLSACSKTAAPSSPAESRVLEINATASSSRDGAHVYEKYCVACHGSGAKNILQLGDRTGWQQLLLEKGIHQLYSNTLNGINAMPPKGLCISCSQGQLLAAVDYILSQAQLDQH